jgi:gluconokinase
MIFVITGTAESGRNTVGKLLAEDLGWEFVDGENLRSPHLDAWNRNAFLANVDASFRIETLLAAIKYWLYQWQDVVVSCPALAEAGRKQLSQISSLVKIVCLETSPTGASSLLDREGPVRVVGSELPDGRGAKREPDWEGLPVDLNRQVEEIIREMVSAK